MTTRHFERYLSNGDVVLLKDDRRLFITDVCYDEVEGKIINSKGGFSRSKVIVSIDDIADEFVLDIKEQEIRVGDIIKVNGKFGRVIALKPQFSLDGSKFKYYGPQSGLLMIECKTNEESWEYIHECELVTGEGPHGIYD